MKTICQQLNIKTFPFIIKDDNGNEIYLENSTGYWVKKEFDSSGNQIYYEDSSGHWVERKFDSNSKVIYMVTPNGIIIDKRSKAIELTLDDIAKRFNVNVEDLKIKK